MSTIDKFCYKNASGGTGGMNLQEIKQELQRLGLPINGIRSELRIRLCDALGKPVPKPKPKPKPKPLSPSPKSPSPKSPSPKSPSPKSGPKSPSPKSPSPKSPSPKSPSPKSGPKSPQADDDDIYISKFPISNPPKPQAVARTALDDAREASELEELNKNLPEIFKKDRKIIFLEGEILNTLSSMVLSKVEHGGIIDVKLSGEFERAVFALGKSATINISDLTDFEISYHTHPFRTDARGKTYYDVPSIMDAQVAYANKYRENAQVHLVFAYDAIYSIYCNTGSTKSLIHTLFNEDSVVIFNSNIGTINKYIKLLKTYKVYVFRHSLRDDPVSVLNPDHNPATNGNWPKRVPLYLNPQEPGIHITRHNVTR